MSTSHPPQPDPASAKSAASTSGTCWWRAMWDFLSGLGLATGLLLILGLLTWLATLEQVDHGLYPTLRKYFDWRSPLVIPEVFGKRVPLPLPGGYWTCALLLVNLTLGGIVRIRKGWRSVGNLISHFGIIFLLVAGGVAHHQSQRGHMQLYEGETSNVATDFLDYDIEIAEIRDGQPVSIRAIENKHLEDLRERSRVFRLPGLPFDLEVSGWLENCAPVSTMRRAPTVERIVDGFFLFENPPMNKSEENIAGCYAMVVRPDGTKDAPFILFGGAFQPYTIHGPDGRVFTATLRKHLWPMPLAVRLDAFRATFHPGTNKPKSFESDVTRIERGSEARAYIRMNEPMRYESLTFYQASYGQSGGPMSGGAMYSVFEIVRNPADQWPKYSLYIVAFGMLVTFLTHLTGHLNRTFSRKS